jgi:hypothetical protein
MQRDRLPRRERPDRDDVLTGRRHTLREVDLRHETEELRRLPVQNLDSAGCHPTFWIVSVWVETLTVPPDATPRDGVAPSDNATTTTVGPPD